MLQVNIIAMFSIVKAAVEHMKPGSTIVNISSVAGGWKALYHAMYRMSAAHSRPVLSSWCMQEECSVWGNLAVC